MYPGYKHKGVDELDAKNLGRKLHVFCWGWILVNHKKIASELGMGTST